MGKQLDDVKVTTRKGSEMVPCYALSACGNVAVTLNLDDPDWFTVTHLPTGRGLANSPSLTAAKRTMGEFTALALDWTKLNSASMGMTPAIKAQCEEIRERAPTGKRKLA